MLTAVGHLRQLYGPPPYASSQLTIQLYSQLARNGHAVQLFQLKLLTIQFEFQIYFWANYCEQ